jgi:hypothetical protein
MAQDMPQRDCNKQEGIELPGSIVQSSLLEALKSVGRVLIESIESIVQTIESIHLYWIIL